MDSDAERLARIKKDVDGILEWAGDVMDDTVFLLRLLSEAEADLERMATWDQRMLSVIREYADRFIEAEAENKRLREAVERRSLLKESAPGAEARAYERAARVVEEGQESHRSNVPGEKDGPYISPRRPGNLAGLAYADAIRALIETPEPKP